MTPLEQDVEATALEQVHEILVGRQVLPVDQRGADAPGESQDWLVRPEREMGPQDVPERPRQRVPLPGGGVLADEPLGLGAIVLALGLEQSGSCSLTPGSGEGAALLRRTPWVAPSLEFRHLPQAALPG